MKNAPLPTSSAPAPAWTIVAKAALKSPFVCGFHESGFAARWHDPPPPASFNSVSMSGAFGSIRHGHDRGLGNQLVQQSQPLGRKSVVSKDHARDVAARPVKAGDKPSLTGSPPTTKTIGIVAVAALAASAGGVFPTITAT